MVLMHASAQRVFLLLFANVTDDVFLSAQGASRYAVAHFVAPAGFSSVRKNQSLVDALLQIKATAKQNDFDVGLDDYDSKRFNRKTGHPLHVAKSDRCKLLAHARVQLFGEMKREPTDWGQQIGWAVPPRPPSTNTYAIRDPNGEVLQGHTVNNVNPDHQHVLFRSY